MLRKKSPEIMLDRASAEERDSRTVLAMQLSQSTKEKDLKVRVENFYIVTI